MRIRADIPCVKTNCIRVVKKLVDNLPTIEETLVEVKDDILEQDSYNTVFPDNHKSVEKIAEKQALLRDLIIQ